MEMALMIIALYAPVKKGFAGRADRLLRLSHLSVPCLGISRAWPQRIQGNRDDYAKICVHEVFNCTTVSCRGFSPRWLRDGAQAADVHLAWKGIGDPQVLNLDSRENRGEEHGRPGFSCLPTT